MIYKYEILTILYIYIKTNIKKIKLIVKRHIKSFKSIKGIYYYNIIFYSVSLSSKLI